MFTFVTSCRTQASKGDRAGFCEGLGEVVTGLAAVSATERPFLISGAEMAALRRF